MHTGCVLKNVDYVYAVVVYTGDDTKVRVKQSKKYRKRATVESGGVDAVLLVCNACRDRCTISTVINKNISLLLLLLLGVCALGSVGYAIFTHEFSLSYSYLKITTIQTIDILKKIATFFLLEFGIIPISLYVSMKITRTGQKLFLEWDRECCYLDEDLSNATGGKVRMVQVWSIKRAGFH